MDVYAYLFEDILLLCKCVNTKRGGGGTGGGGGGATTFVHNNSSSTSSSQTPFGGSNCCRLRPIHPPMKLSHLIVNPAGGAQSPHPTSSSTHTTPFTHSIDQTTPATSTAVNNTGNNHSSQQATNCHINSNNVSPHFYSNQCFF